MRITNMMHVITTTLGRGLAIGLLALSSSSPVQAITNITKREKRPTSGFLKYALENR
jgi:hypothetical protein